MTRQEFNDCYFVEPVFEEFRVFFYVYKKEKIDYITPAIELQKDFDKSSIWNENANKEIKEQANLFICNKYNIVE